MAAKVVFFIVSAVLVQNALSQCLNSYGLGVNPAGIYGIGGAALNALDGFTPGYNSVGLANSALLGGAGYGWGGVGYGLGGVGYGLGGVGYGLGGVGYGLGGVGYGLGLDVVGPSYGAGLVGYPDLVGYPSLGAIGSSGPLPVSTISPIGPSGLAVASENEIAGTVLASGTLPFLSAVAFEGALPTAGSGVATCGCGNGVVGITSEGFPGPFLGSYPAALPGYATIGNGFGGIYY